MKSRFFRDVGTFVGAWFVLWAAMTLAILLMGAFFQLEARGEFVGPYGSPLFFALVICIPGGFALAVAGAPFLPFRRWIVQPRFPYLRPGYLAVAASQILVFIVIYPPVRAWDVAPVFWPELYVFIGALIFVALGRGLGLFDADEWPAPKTEPQSADNA